MKFLAIFALVAVCHASSIYPLGGSVGGNSILRYLFNRYPSLGYQVGQNYPGVEYPVVQNYPLVYQQYPYGGISNIWSYLSRYQGYGQQYPLQGLIGQGLINQGLIGQQYPYGQYEQYPYGQLYEQYQQYPYGYGQQYYPYSQQYQYGQGSVYPYSQSYYYRQSSPLRYLLQNYLQNYQGQYPVVQYPYYGIGQGYQQIPEISVY